LVKLYPNGTIYVSPPALITTACKLNVENFPYDQKVCTMTWGSWMYPKDIISLKNSAPTVNLDSYIRKYLRIYKYLIDPKIVLFKILNLFKL
jgi:hypothetical protein